VADQDGPDPQFDAMTARLLRREALRRAAEEMNTTSAPGLEGVLAWISAEVTAEAARRRAATVGTKDRGTADGAPVAQFPSLESDQCVTCCGSAAI
jgi:hypothetical protein